MISAVIYWARAQCIITLKFLQACGNLQKLLPQLLGSRFRVIFILLIALVFYLFVYDIVVKPALEYATPWSLITVDVIMTSIVWIME